MPCHHNKPLRERRAVFELANRFAALMLGVALLCGLEGCGRDPDLYTLASVAGPIVPPGVGTMAGPSVVEVRTPVVSAALDRDEIVRLNKDYRLKIAKGDAWAQPLGDMIGRTMTLDLAQRLPGVTVFAQNDAVETRPQAFVEITVTAFNEDQNGQAVIQGNMSVHAAQDGPGPVRTLPFYYTKALPSRGTANLVFSLSQLLARVADDASVSLRNCRVKPPQ